MYILQCYTLNLYDFTLKNINVESEKVLNFGSKLFLPPPPILGDAGMTLMSTGGADSPLSKSSERVDPKCSKKHNFSILRICSICQEDKNRRVAKKYHDCQCAQKRA